MINNLQSRLYTTIALKVAADANVQSNKQNMKNFTELISDGRIELNGSYPTENDLNFRMLLCFHVNSHHHHQFCLLSYKQEGSQLS